MFVMLINFLGGITARTDFSALQKRMFPRIMLIRKLYCLFSFVMPTIKVMKNNEVMESNEHKCRRNKANRHVVRSANRCQIALRRAIVIVLWQSNVKLSLGLQES